MAVEGQLKISMDLVGKGRQRPSGSTVPLPAHPSRCHAERGLPSRLLKKAHEGMDFGLRDV
jgi:hypothetical protein